MKEEISPFYIQKALDAITGKVKSVSRLRKLTLLVEEHSGEQA
jgi:hypothetical protein